MKNKNLVSVIIPYFKKRNFLKKTIKSIVSQTYKNIEIILIYDDKNLDDLFFIEDLLKNVKNKKIIINKKNLGPGFSRNKGILKSNGSYIAFCDADDIWNKNKLSSQIKYMKKYNLDFSHTSYLVIDKFSKKIGSYEIQEKLNYNNLIKSCDVGLSTVVGKKKIFLKNKFTSLKTKEDYLLWLKLLKKRKYIFGTNKYLSSWRFLEDSLSSSLVQKLSDSFKLYNKYEKYNFLLSIFFVSRLSYFALLKKIQIYLMRG
tara:strand:- start:251 stop:1024 length:774 start_codon:yes stop_codon:yes gene_type:complete